MARCKGCIHDNVCNRDVGHGYSVCPHYITADVVPKSEVVRCKDCKHFYQDRNVKVCRHWNCHSTEEDAYCSYAKKKGGAERVCTDCIHFVGCECFSGMTCDQYETEVKNND